MRQVLALFQSADGPIPAGALNVRSESSRTWGRSTPAPSRPIARRAGFRDGSAYLLDENVLREFGARGNVNVHKWLAMVDDTDLRLSVATFFERRRGAEMLARRDLERAKVLLDAIAVLGRPMPTGLFQSTRSS